jgi:anti-sigma28 factor (negative regulator of flagellin synthesis)
VRISAYRSAEFAENQKASSSPRSALESKSESTATLVEISAVSQVVAELRHTLNTQGLYGDVRTDVIERLRQDIASGRLGGEEDIDAVLSSLLRSL